MDLQIDRFSMRVSYVGDFPDTVHAYHFDQLAELLAFLEGLKFSFYINNPSDYALKYGTFDYPKDHMAAKHCMGERYHFYKLAIDKFRYHYGFELL